jgi:hypothetical protein
MAPFYPSPPVRSTPTAACLCGVRPRRFGIRSFDNTLSSLVRRLISKHANPAFCVVSEIFSRGFAQHLNDSSLGQTTTPFNNLVKTRTCRLLRSGRIVPMCIPKTTDCSSRIGRRLTQRCRCLSQHLLKYLRLLSGEGDAKCCRSVLEKLYQDHSKKYNDSRTEGNCGSIQWPVPTLA